MHPVLPAARRHSPSTRSQHLVQISGALNKKKRFPLFCWNVENLNKGRRKVSLVDWKKKGIFYLLLCNSSPFCAHDPQTFNSTTQPKETTLERADFPLQLSMFVTAENDGRMFIMFILFYFCQLWSPRFWATRGWACPGHESSNPPA